MAAAMKCQAPSRAQVQQRQRSHVSMSGADAGWQTVPAARDVTRASAVSRGATAAAGSLKASTPAAASTITAARGAALVARYATSTASTLPLDGPALTVRTRVVVPYHPTSHGQQLVLVGSCEELGNWDPKKGVKFTWCEGHSHEAELELPVHTNVSCKLVVLGEHDSNTWEPEANRELLLAPASLASRAAGYTMIMHWGFPDCVQVMANSLRRGTGVSPGSSGRASPGLNGSSGGVMGNPLIAGMKKALEAASSRERFSSVISGSASWEDEFGADDEPVLTQCQVTVLMPKNGPKLKPEQSLVLVGSSAALGRWDPANGLPLERAGEDSPMWTSQAELPLGDSLQAKVVVVDGVSGKAEIWEPCENRSLARYRGSKPVMVTAYYGVAPTHSLEVDRLSAAAAAGSPQVVALLRQQLANTSSQLDGLRRERDDARKAVADKEQAMKSLEGKANNAAPGRFEMVHLAEQLQTTRKLYEVTKKEAMELGGTVGVTRQLCDAAKKELAGLSKQLIAAQKAYEALAPQVERMEKQLASTNRAFDATKPELAALEAQLERARGLFDRTLSKIEAAKSLASGSSATASGDYDLTRRRVDSRVREMQFAK
ncbi:hypothetical protein HYH02_001056 [Chlamydomonas schloesseri]|uniref:CBM20 domain-containing protein n=1 Tax=Chlamydomonas schloesseri TaxID=2026947 RepID=A0A836BCQ7_9CHLO|nr:hypothetical protein HYH02_001056 [Chlamydomonas schloesseri]|eukprot:KAG2454014.1 hypothetical protein HYH02_001056 [Chlamydomonas schloesseri]